MRITLSREDNIRTLHLLPGNNTGKGLRRGVSVFVEKRAVDAIVATAAIEAPLGKHCHERGSHKGNDGRC